MEKKYLKEFNILRGMAVILVVLGHSFIGGTSQSKIYMYLYKFIYSFHMPIFFFISGFFAIKILELKDIKSKTKFIKIKAKKLMIPYLFITLLAIPLKVVMSSFVSRPIIIEELILDIVIYPTNNPVISLWFIYAIFIMFIIGVIVANISNLNKIILGVVLLITSSLYTIELFNINGVFKNVIFFFIGLTCAQYYDSIKKILINNSLRIIVLTMALLVFINIFNFNEEIIDTIMYLITGLLGIILTLTISIKLVNNNKILNNGLDLIGSYSLDIYLFSWFTQNCIGYIFYKILNIDYSTVIILTFISGFLPIIISKYIIRKNSYLKRIFLGL